MSKTELAWHFVREVDGKRILRDGSPLVVGKWLEHRGELELCASGLHASTRAIDALQYAPGDILCLVECGGEIIRGDDKLVCSRRRPLWAKDVTEEFRLFARLCALDVVHLWNPSQLVLDFLHTGDESMREAAMAAVWAVAWAAEWAAAWDAARAAAGDAARAAARDAAGAAARAAAGAAAVAAAGAAARAAARAAQNSILESLFMDGME